MNSKSEFKCDRTYRTTQKGLQSPFLLTMAETKIRAFLIYVCDTGADEASDPISVLRCIQEKETTQGVKRKDRINLLQEEAHSLSRN